MTTREKNPIKRKTLIEKKTTKVIKEKSWKNYYLTFLL